MFFLNIGFYFVKPIFFTKTNLALIKILFPTINCFETVRNNTFAMRDFVLQNETFSRVGPHLHLSLSYSLFHKMGFDLNSFYDIERMESLLESFSFFLLLVTVFIYWFETAFHSKVGKPEFASSLVKLSNFSLTFLLGTRWITSHHFPLSNLYESLLFLSWSLTVIHLILEKISHTLLIGVLLSPITLFINGFALFTLPTEMQKGNFLTPALQSNWLMMHVTVMISSYAALLSGSILAIAFLVITRNTIKNDRSTSCETKCKESVIAVGLVSQEGANHESPNFILQNKIDPMVAKPQSSEGSMALKAQLPEAMVLQSKSKQLTSDPEDFFFNKITKKSYKSLAFVGQNKQLLPNPEVFFQEIDLSEKENSFSKNKKRDSNFFLLKPFSNLSQSKNKDAKNLTFAKQKKVLASSKEGLGFNEVKTQKSTEENILQNRTNLATTLDNLSYRTIGIGFPLLTIGILSGAVWANEAWGSYWSWDPKETWALITWFLFAIYLHTRITKGLQGEKPAIIATIGFVVVWICFLGVNLASQGLHTYGWLQ